MAGPDAFAAGAVADGARGPVDRGRGEGRGGGPRRRRHRRVVGGHGAAILVIEPSGDRRHGFVPPQVRGVVVQLLLQIAGVETGQTRRADAVAGAVQAVAGEAGVPRAALAAAERDQLAVGGERLAAMVRRPITSGQRDEDDKAEEGGAHPDRTPASPWRFPARNRCRRGGFESEAPEAKARAVFRQATGR
jgi:hypothetical protein